MKIVQVWTGMHWHSAKAIIMGELMTLWSGHASRVSVYMITGNSSLWSQLLYDSGPISTKFAVLSHVLSECRLLHLTLRSILNEWGSPMIEVSLNGLAIAKPTAPQHFCALQGSRHIQVQSTFLRFIAGR